MFRKMAAKRMFEVCEPRNYLTSVGFAEHTVVELPNESTVASVVAGDIDADGHTDLVFASAEGTAWSRNLGDGSFGVPKLITSDASTILHIGDVAVGDIDGDKDLDLRA